MLSMANARLSRITIVIPIMSDFWEANTMLDTVFLNKLRLVFAMVVTLAVLVVAFFVPGLLAKALVAAVIGAVFGLTHAVMIRLMMELTAIKSVLAKKVME